jgi:hypothetical protein
MRKLCHRPWFLPILFLACLIGFSCTPSGDDDSAGPGDDDVAGDDDAAVDDDSTVDDDTATDDDTAPDDDAQPDDDTTLNPTCQWTVMDSGTKIDLYTAWGASPTDVYAGGGIPFETNGVVLHYDGTTWSSSFSIPYLPVASLWGASSTDIYAVAGGDIAMGAVFRDDGSHWKLAKIVWMSVLSSIWGSSPTDIYAAGMSAASPSPLDWTAVVYHFDGQQWTKTLLGSWLSIFYAISGSSASNVFAVGSDFEGEIAARFDGQTWSDISTGLSTMPETSMYGVWVASESDAWAVGDNPDDSGESKVFHYDGSSWSPQAIPAGNQLSGIWGSSPTDIFTVGYSNLTGNCVILHYDGSSWSPMKCDQGQILVGVWGTSSCNVFAVGSGGTILHYGK